MSEETAMEYDDVASTNISTIFIAFMSSLHSEIFIGVNHEIELYFNIISFQKEESRVYVSDINIVVFKRQS